MKTSLATIISPVLSFFDEEVRQFIRSMEPSISPDSWLRNPKFRRAFDVIREAVERGFHFDSKVLEAVKGKIVDYGDYFTSAVGGEGAGEPSRAKVTKVAKDWMDEFSAEAKARLAKTPSEKFEEESQEILLEFELRRGFFEALDEKMREAKGETVRSEPSEPEDEVSIDWDEIQRQHEAFLVRLARLPGKDRQGTSPFHQFANWLDS